MNKCQWYAENNPTLRWIVFQRKGAWARVIVLLFLGWLAAFGVCALDGTLRLDGGQKGFLNDYFMHLIPVVLSLAMVCLPWVLGRLDSFLAALPGIVDKQWREAEDDEGAAQNPKEAVDSIKNLVGLRGDSRKPFWGTMAAFGLVFLLMMVLSPLLGVSEAKSWATLPGQHLASYIIAFFWTILWVGVIANLVWYSTATALKTCMVLKSYARLNLLTVRPVSPDGHGGLSVIGDLSYSTSAMVSTGVIGIAAWIFVFEAGPLLFVGSAIYAVLLIFLFFVPLYSVHRSMARAKEKELKFLSSIFDSEYSKLTDLVVPGLSETSNLSIYTNSLNGIDSLYSRAERMPVWPFEMSILGRLLFVVMIPFIAAVIQGAWANILTDWLKQFFGWLAGS